jgi:transcriptional regulator with XRE-family HTH domain
MVDDESNRTVTSTPGQKFGRRLREQRERHQITLDAIASSTKIKMSLFAGLERGDIAEWPAGIFQRAFVREYARAIGLAPEPVVAEFARVFAPGSARAENGATASAGELRLTLAHEPLPVPPIRTPALAVLAEAVCLAVLAAVVSWVTASGFGATCGALALLYYPIGTAWLGCSPVGWYLKREADARTASRAPERLEPVVAEKRDRLYLVKPAAESDPASPFPRSAAR